MNYQRGYFGIGIENSKDEKNLGTLWRSAHVFGAAFIFTIRKRYGYQYGDTTKAWKHVPLFHYESFAEFYAKMPRDCKLIGVELIESAEPLASAIHPERAIYLLGAEDVGLSATALEKTAQIIILPGKLCLNVAVAGSIVMYDRTRKAKKLL